MEIKKYLAFTLAEILITIAIIGTVSAITIPTLKYNTVQKERSTKLKRFYSKMDNAIEQMNVEHPFREMILPSNNTNAFTWYMQNVDPYMGHSKVNESTRTVYYNDGSSLSNFHTGGCIDIDYDVNGNSKPNVQGKDIFRFLYCFDDGERETWFNNKDIFFGTYGGGINSADISREQMLNRCAKKDAAIENEGRDGRVWCSRLLQNDQWEFKKDYPW